MTKEVATLPEHNIAQIVDREISRADPAVAAQMLELRITWEKREAEKEFIAARSRLQFPAIPKSKHGVNSNYASWDGTQEIITPILAEEGFTLSFTSGPPNEQGMIPITGKLSHRLGHSETGTVYQPIGAASRGMNANQAMGSAISYGERYCAAMMLNLRFIDIDDDAQTFSMIDERQRLTLEKLIAECKMGPESVSKFLTVVGVKAIGDILKRDYEAALNLLLKKRKQVLEKTKK